jgi:hypothetical protein
VIIYSFKALNVAQRAGGPGNYEEYLNRNKRLKY